VLSIRHGAVYYFVLKTRVLTISFILQLAVQAGTGAARAYCSSVLDDTTAALLESFDETTAFNSRLSRVVAKLFAR
jgi:hypothetical protein